jgi:peptide deformylase
MVTSLNIQRNSMAQQHLEFLAQGFQHRCGQLRGAFEDHGEELLAERPKKTH